MSVEILTDPQVDTWEDVYGTVWSYRFRPADRRALLRASRNVSVDLDDTLAMLARRASEAASEPGKRAGTPPEIEEWLMGVADQCLIEIISAKRKDGTDYVFRAFLPFLIGGIPGLGPRVAGSAIGAGNKQRLAEKNGSSVPASSENIQASAR